MASQRRILGRRPILRAKRSVRVLIERDISIFFNVQLSLSNNTRSLDGDDAFPGIGGDALVSESCMNKEDMFGDVGLTVSEPYLKSAAMSTRLPRGRPFLTACCEVFQLM